METKEREERRQEERGRKERERRERREKEEREKERPRETSNWREADIVVTHITATVPKPGVTSSRPAFKEKRWKESESEKEREGEKERNETDRQRERERERERERGSLMGRPVIGARPMSLPPTSPPQPCQSRS